MQAHDSNLDSFLRAGSSTKAAGPGRTWLWVSQCQQWSACTLDKKCPVCKMLSCTLLAGFPSGAMVKNQHTNTGDARDSGLIPGLGRSPGVGNSNLLQYPCLENSMDRGAWWVTVHGVAKTWTQLSTQTLKERPRSTAWFADLTCRIPWGLEHDHMSHVFLFRRGFGSAFRIIWEYRRQEHCKKQKVSPLWDTD